MVKSKLISALTNQLLDEKLAEKELSHCINLIIDLIRNTLGAGGRIEIRGFGSFCLHYQARRNAHNPKTGEKVIAQPRYRPHFKPGKELRDRVNLAKTIKKVFDISDEEFERA
jgi:integration host factor subunit beta